jgi:ubiquinone/menaquinone biosynthesis C-methylase UbiE
LTAFQNPAGSEGSESGGSSRFAALEAFYDPETIRLLYARGIDEGWRCLEVGAGSGSVAKWMLSRVGTYGRVVITDLDISEVESIDEPTVEIHRHDIVHDPIPENVFHLVHARLVLGGLPERDLALERMAASLRSDGWIVIEELDRQSLVPDSDDPAAVELFNRTRDAIAAALTAKGLDPYYGRRVFRKLRGFGLVSAIARGGSTVQEGGSPAAELLKEEIESLRDEMLATGAVTADDIEACLRLLEAPEFAFHSPTMITTWARRPSPF